MVKIVQIVRQASPTAEAYVGLNSEMVHDTTLGTLRIHDGSTTGGTILATRAYADQAEADAKTYALNLVTNGFASAYVQYAGGSGDEGKVSWNDDDGTLDIILQNETTVLQVGQEVIVQAKAVGSAIADGELVYVSGAVGASGKFEIGKFLADGSIPSFHILGVATEAIALNEFGFVTLVGKVRGISTNGSAYAETWVDGDVLYASPTNAGGYTKTKPTVRNIRVS